jgi:hypothetical protein
VTGVLDVPADQYHRDELGDQPTLSASIAKVLVSRSPLHAWTAHPRLNPACVRQEDPKFDVGVVAHAVILEGVDPLNVVEVCEFDSWRSGAAKDAAAAARAAGKIPLLGGHYFDVLQMVEAARRQMDAHGADPPLLRDGKPEQTLAWDEDGVACRARLDWLRDDLAAIDDVKTTTRSANPEAWKRSTLFAMGYDVQAAFYLHGCRALGWEPRWRWLVVETTAPYALSVIEPDEETLAVGNAKVDYALQLWRDCLANDRWPAYGTGVFTATPPPWELRWLETPELEETAWAQLS